MPRAVTVCHARSFDSCKGWGLTNLDGGYWVYQYHARGRWSRAANIGAMARGWGLDAMGEFCFGGLAAARREFDGESEIKAKNLQLIGFCETKGFLRKNSN